MQNKIYASRNGKTYYNLEWIEWVATSKMNPPKKNQGSTRTLETKQASKCMQILSSFAELSGYHSLIPDCPRTAIQLLEQKVILLPQSTQQDNYSNRLFLLRLQVFE